MQVTVGLGRLHQLLQRLSLTDPEPPPVEVRGSGGARCWPRRRASSTPLAY